MWGILEQGFAPTIPADFLQEVGRVTPLDDPAKDPT